MLAPLVILILSLSLVNVYSFHIHKSQGIRTNSITLKWISYISSHKFLFNSTPDDISWRIDEDTSELDCESSAGLARLSVKKEAEAARIAAEAARLVAVEAARIEAERIALEKKSNNNQIIATTVETTNTVAITSTINDSTVKDNNKLTPGNKKSAFDIGLILVFPLMIGTLLLFLFFPLIGAQLAGSSPSL